MACMKAKTIDKALPKVYNSRAFRKTQKKQKIQYRGVAQFGSIEPDRVRWTMKEGRNGAAVKVSVPPQGTKETLGTARVNLLWEPT